jgi:hypothetical protein
VCNKTRHTFKYLKLSVDLCYCKRHRVLISMVRHDWLHGMVPPATL